jgi:L-lactate dehydrogenase complex protein LldE
MKSRAALFIPCLTAEVEPETGLHMAKLVERAGFEAVYPEGQTCCGQPWFNTGYRSDAAAYARKFLRLFDDFACDCIVSPSGSCLGMVKHHYPELDLSSEDRARHARLVPKLLEFSEFMALHGAGLRFAGPAEKVYYHPSCHLTREMGVKRPPLDLLGRVGGAEVVTDIEPLCCGFGGTFSIKMPSLSAAMTGRKVEQVRALHAPDRWVVPDASCLLQIRGWAEAHGVPVRAQHLIDYLHERVR